MTADTALEVGRLYQPIKRIADILTAGQEDIFIRLPGLLGYFPMSITDGIGKAVNHAQGAIDLTQQGVCPIGYDGNSYRHLGDGANYLFAPVGYGLTGTEVWIDPNLAGFTIGGWFLVDSLPPTVFAGMMSKDAPPPQRGYNIQLSTDGSFYFQISSNGSAAFSAQSEIYSISAWRFIVGRFTPSVSVDIFVDGSKTSNTTAIPALCFVSSQRFEIGRFQASDTRTFHGRARDVFVCFAALDDELIAELGASSAA